VLISRFKMQRFLDAAERWRHEDVVNEIGGDVIALSLLPRQQQQHRLHLAYRVTCDATFYGPGCDRLCVPRDDVFGHYDCDVTTGERVCRDGWNGTYCETGACHCQQKPRCYFSSENVSTIRFYIALYRRSLPRVRFTLLATCSL
jgi:Delta serrate ligand